MPRPIFIRVGRVQSTLALFECSYALFTRRLDAIRVPFLGALTEHRRVDLTYWLRLSAASVEASDYNRLVAQRMRGIVAIKREIVRIKAFEQIDRVVALAGEAHRQTRGTRSKTGQIRGKIDPRHDQQDNCNYGNANSRPLEFYSARPRVSCIAFESLITVYVWVASVQLDSPYGRRGPKVRALRAPGQIATLLFVIDPYSPGSNSGNASSPPFFIAAKWR